MRRYSRDFLRDPSSYIGPIYPVPTPTYISVSKGYASTVIIDPISSQLG